jgi:hypothetical protein
MIDRFSGFGLGSDDHFRKPVASAYARGVCFGSGKEAAG